MDHMTINPYAAPRVLPPDAFDESTLCTPVRPLRSLARWTLICAISAAPSFFWGCGLHRELQHIAGMLCGIGVFVLAYTAFECTQAYHQLIRMPYVYRTVLIGYGTRIAISILFPIGLALDMVVGIFSVTIVEDSFVVSASLQNLDYSAANFFVVLLTTLLQGVFLNTLLVAFMMMVYGIQWTFGRRQRASHAGRAEVA
jgi:hypothetical protein